MLEFKEFQLTDYRLISEYRVLADLNTCELAGGTVFMWRDYYRPSFCIHKNTLIIKRETEDGSGLFFFPMGEDVENAIAEIEAYCLNKNISLTFYGVEKKQLEYLKQRYNGLVRFHTARAWCDYLYDAESFAFFKGRKYNGQRNHVNKFLRVYPDAVASPFTEADVSDALALVDLYAEQKGVSSKMGLREIAKSKECLENFSALGLTGLCVRISGRLASFTIGEKCGKTQVIHIEKASREYEGIYPFTASAYAKTALDGGAEILNREDDAGDPGLRKSKLQYQPIELMYKYYVEIIRPEKRIRTMPTMFAYGLTLNGFTDADGLDYLALTSDENNRLFNSSNRADAIMGNTVEAIKRDFENAVSIRFAVRDGANLVGEAEFFNFRFGGECEVGLRLLLKYQSEGFAEKILKRVCDFLICELGFMKLYLRPNKEDEPTQRMIASAGFTATEDGADAKIYLRNADSIIKK